MNCMYIRLDVDYMCFILLLFWHIPSTSMLEPCHLPSIPIDSKVAFLQPGQTWPLGRFPEAWRGLRPGAQLSPVLGEALRCARCARCARPVAGSDL